MSAFLVPQPTLHEVVARRILASFVCVDALTGSTITRPLSLQTDPTPQGAWTIAPNRNGTYIVYDGPGLSSLTTQFIPNGPLPAVSDIQLTLQDPARVYLPRRAKVQAPQAVPVIPPRPAGSLTNPAALAAQADSTTIFASQRVLLYPVASASTSPNWAVVRASVVNAGSQAGLSGAVLRVVRDSDSAVLATGVTGPNGEALLAVIGLTTKPNTMGGGPVTLATTAATITAFADPAISAQAPGSISDPDDLISNLANPTLKSSSQPVQLASGRELILSFALAV